MRFRTARWAFIIPLAYFARLLSAQPFAPTQCLQSEARPPLTPADIKVVEGAIQILGSPASWNRTGTRDCPVSATTFTLEYALENASDEVTGQHEHRQAALQEARFVIAETAPRAKDHNHRLLEYNNDPATTFRDIERVLRLLRSRIAERLDEDPAKAQAEAARLAAYCAGIELRIANRVLEILDSPAKWNRGSTQNCSPGALTFGIYCAFAKASSEIIGDFDGGGAAMDEARKLIGETAPNRDRYQARLVDYNNDPTVTFEDMRNLLRTVEQRTAKREHEAANALPQ